jgi:hypothetical protein
VGKKNKNYQMGPQSCSGLKKFRGVQIEKERLESPSQNREDDPETYLYQLGYLSLRPSQSIGTYTLDYPYFKVRVSLSRHLMDSYFDSPSEAGKIRDKVKKALISREPKALVEELNLFISKIPYDY